MAKGPTSPFWRRDGLSHGSWFPTLKIEPRQDVTTEANARPHRGLRRAHIRPSAQTFPQP
jgi:hypothetical protein